MRFFDLIITSFRNLLRQSVRTILTIVSIMVGAFLMSTLMSVGRGLEAFMVRQVTLFSDERMLDVSKAQGGFMMMGLGGNVQEYEEESAEDDKDAKENEDAGSNGEAESEFESILSESRFDSDDLEEIRAIDHVEEAEFQGFVEIDYVQLKEDDGKKLQATVLSLPETLLKEMTYFAYDENLIGEDDSIVLPAGFAESWGKEIEELIGEKVNVQVSTESPVIEENAQAAPTMPYGPPAAPVGKIETKIFEYKIAGFIEKSIFSQMAFVSPDASKEIGAFRFQKDPEEYKKDESGFEIVVIVDSLENVEEVDKKIEEMDFVSYTSDEFLGQIGVIFDVISYFLGSFGVVALVVASVGIANTLFMAVYERTREIGVSKAVGATQRVIWTMFTVEAVLLGFFGGLFGLLIGWGVGAGADWALHNGINIGGAQILPAVLEDYPTLDISIFSVGLMVTVVMVTTLVALVAGLYPARRASRLNPIEALRHD